MSPLVESLARMEPGPKALLLLTSLDVESLDDASRLVVLAAWERQQRWVMARTQHVLVTIAGEHPTRCLAPDDRADDDVVREEIACALGISGAAAAARMYEARNLCTLLPGTLELLERGALSWRHALAMVDVCAQAGHDPAVLAGLEHRVLIKGPTQTPAAFRRAVSRELSAVQPEAEAAAHDIAKAQRSVQLWPQPNGMAMLAALLPAVDARAAYQVIDEMARGARGSCDEHGVVLGADARRVEAFLGLILGFAEPDTPAVAATPVRPARPQADVQVVIDLPTLLHLADHPAELVGYGPIPAQVGREVAADSGWRRLVVDPVSGHLLDYGRRIYRPPQLLADYVRARDRTCTFPGCSQPAVRCDIDHRLPWDKGGPTAAHNCGPLCRRHHRLKTHHGWRVHRAADGTILWSSPAGLRYRVIGSGEFARSDLDDDRPPSAASNPWSPEQPPDAPDAPPAPAAPPAAPADTAPVETGDDDACPF